ncbi:hypothetical protein NZK35_21940 [Stieleria sp. ICT_E10.1]|uniref:hypothetical protein n=1 Tax=Stieleria sedimenti TaxID=2976331 RepID=UPI00217F2A48|nr:hypothetical protein [Stieleria sedimenti]MCS7469321.1 hypothetical protein [Stieleria sedimenti]
MADLRLPGPVGTSDTTLPNDSGTNQCRLMPTPGTVGRDGGVEVMSLDDRFVKVLHLTVPKLPAEIQEEFAAMLSPASIGIIVGVLVVWAGSHYFGIGFIADALLLIVGLGFLGWQVWSVGNDFVAFVELTYSARTEADLEKASKHLANFLAVVGVAAFMALIAKGAKRYGPKIKNMRGIIKAATASDAGMPPNHFRAFLRAAANPSRPRIILVRQTNPKSVRWIQKGFPAKPKEIKFKTSKQTGIVTCKDISEVAKAQKTVRSGSNKQYFVVDRNRRTATNGKGETIDVSNADWPVEPGQVVDPLSQKPLVGDYDLMGVIDPNAKGRNIALAVDNTANARAGKPAGTLTDDFTNTDIKKVAADVNKQLDQDRVLHGSQEAFDSLDNLAADELVVGFFPDGQAMSFNREGLKTFYQSIGRSTLDLKKFMD